MSKLAAFRSILITSISKIGMAASSALGAVLVANLYGQAGLGIFALIRTLPAVLVVFTEPGVSHATPYLVNNRKFNEQSVAENAAYTCMFVFLLQIVIWLAGSIFLQKTVFEEIEIQFVLLMACLAPLMVIQIHIANMFRSMMEIGKANYIYLAVEVFMLLLLSVSYFFDIKSYAGLVCIVVASSVLMVFFGLISLWKKGIVFRPKRHDVLLKESISYGLKSQVGNAFQILNYRLDHLIVGFYLGTKLLGIYFVATKAAEIFRFFSASIAFSLESTMARSGEKTALISIRKYYPFIFFGNAILISVAVLIAPYLLPKFFGDWAVEAITPLWILALGVIVSGANGLFGAYNLGCGKPQINTAAIGFGLIFTILGNAILVPLYGVNGAAIASTVTYVATTILFFAFFVSDYRKAFGRKEEANV